MRVPVHAEAAGLPRRAGLPALEPRRVEHHGGGGVAAVAQRGGHLVARRLVVDLQGGQKDVALGVHLHAADSEGEEPENKGLTKLDLSRGTDSRSVGQFNQSWGTFLDCSM